MSGRPSVRRPQDGAGAARVLREADRPPLLTGSAPADPSALTPPVRRSLGEEGRVVVSSDRLAGVEDYRPEDLTVTAGAGTRVEALQERLRGEGQWLPVSGAALARSVGGLVASAPATPYAAEYGPVRRQVLAVRVVTYDGERLDWGRAVVKDVAGYDMPRLACGSRGRLGLLTRVTFRVWPLPEGRRRFALVDGDGGGGSAAATVGVDAGEDWRPAAEAWSWSADGEEGPALIVELAGSEASAEARERRLREWSEGRGIEVQRRPPATPPAPLPPGAPGRGRGRSPRPAALRFRVDPRYVGRAVAALRASGVTRRIAAYPREGVVVASFSPGGGGLDALEAVSDAAPDATAQVERGRPRLHEAVASRRAPARVEVERRVLDALGGRDRRWAADFV